MASLLLARHGLKESEDGAVNWHLRLLPLGVQGVVQTAAAAKALGLSVSRIVTSPFPRCIQTAALYAASFSVSSLCVEPGLCEILDDALGGKGFEWPALPSWTLLELEEIATQQLGSDAVRIDTTYDPIIPASDLRREQRNGREEVSARVVRMCEGIREAHAQGSCGLTLYVSHGSPCRRLADLLCPEQAPHKELPMGSIVVVDCGKVIARLCP
jgi:broad specificity phosphatase PhoE